MVTRSTAPAAGPGPGPAADPGRRLIRAVIRTAPSWPAPARR